VSAVYPAVCGLPSAVHIRLFVAPFVDGLPPPPDRLESPSYSLPSAVYSIYRLPSILPSVVRVRRLSRGLRSAVPIRLFVAPFVDGLPSRQARKPVLRSAVRRPYSFIRCPIR
jgi:hypothetical protein